ncbi:alpha-tocopherol transfer protein-like isoform X2 [Ptychodera flava]|uniref:alpha-tocopherol transfer protein-like isoform X2 n=1 Tax=Ptychodera flava TaxID=63121 RepID=UPI003969E4C0
MASNMESEPEEDFVSSLSPELLTKAEKELNEKAQWRQRDINALRDMLEKRPDIYFRSDNAFLLRFLRAKKFDYDRAFQMLVNYYEVRRDYPDIYTELFPSKIQHVWQDSLQAVLPCSDKDGRRVLVFRPGKWDPYKYPIIDIIKANFLSLEKLLEDEETQVNGVVIIIDLSGLSFSHATHIGPIFAKKVTSIFQNAMPVRIKGVHYVNEPRIFEWLFAIIRPFLKEKLKQRIRIHGSNFSSLHEFIPSSSLPSDYGGSLPEFNSKEWMDFMMQFDDQFLESEKYGILGQEMKDVTQGD